MGWLEYSLAGALSRSTFGGHGGTSCKRQWPEMNTVKNYMTRIGKNHGTDRVKKSFFIGAGID